MKKIILYILNLTLLTAACTNNSQDANIADNLEEKIEIEVEREPEQIPDEAPQIYIAEYMTGEIITDGDYEISGDMGSICFVPDKESREIIKEKYGDYSLDFIDDESYFIHYDNMSSTKNLPDKLGIYKVKVKLEIKETDYCCIFYLTDIELCNDIGTILYEGKSYETNDLNLDVRVKDRVSGLIVDSVDRFGDEGIRVGFCGEIETEGYYNISYSEMYGRNLGCIYYDEKYKDNIPIMLGTSNNNELFYFVSKEDLFKELEDNSTFGRGRFKTSNYYLVYNIGMGREPSDILTEIVSLDGNYDGMFPMNDMSSTNLMGYNNDFAIVSYIVEYDENNYPVLFDYYYIKNDQNKMYLLTTAYYYSLKETVDENEFLLRTEGYNAATGSHDGAHEIKCKITDQGAEISYTNIEENSNSINN